MKYLLLLVIISGCATHPKDISRRPSGEEVFGVILRHGNLDLNSEALCKADIKLRDQLALALSVSFENNNTTVVKSNCSPSMFELPTGEVIDVWDCTIQINENAENGDFISSSTFVFSLTTGDLEYLNDSLRCR